MPVTPEEFDQRVGNKLRGERLAAPEGLWADIEARLPRERRRRGGAWWWLGGALAVLLLGLMLSREAAPALEPLAETSASVAPARGRPTIAGARRTIPVTPTTSAASPEVVAETHHASTTPTSLPSAKSPRPSAPPAAHDSPAAFPPGPALARSVGLPTLLALASPRLRPLPAPATTGGPLPQLPLPLPTAEVSDGPDWSWGLTASGGIGQRFGVRRDGTAAGIASQASLFDYANIARSSAGSPRGPGADVTGAPAYGPTSGLRLDVRHRSGLTLAAGALAVPSAVAYLTDAITGDADADLTLTRASLYRIAAEVDLGYTRAFGRWSAVGFAGVGGLAPKRETLGRGGIRLPSRVFAKAGLGVGFALSPRLELQARATYTGIGSRAVFGLRYGF